MAEHGELIVLFILFISKKNRTHVITRGAAERPTVSVVLASLRWYYPGQVLRVVRSGGLSAVRLP
jgi:hypothetical protein